MAFNQEAFLALFAYSNEGSAALGMGALDPSSAAAHFPHQGMGDERMGGHPNLRCGVIHGDGSRSRCKR